MIRRDANIASVMEKEVLSKHRKALMLFGTFHLFHNVGGSAVSIYEKDYPNLTFVVSDLGILGTHTAFLSEGPFAAWPIPSVALAKDTWLGALKLSELMPPPITIDKNCEVKHDFPKPLQRPMQELVDAFIYLGPQDLRLAEKIPADIVLDPDERPEIQRGARMLGLSEAATQSAQAFDHEVVSRAANPLFVIPETAFAPGDPEIERAVKDCRDRQSTGLKQ